MHFFNLNFKQLKCEILLNFVKRNVFNTQKKTLRKINIFFFFFFFLHFTEWTFFPLKSKSKLFYYYKIIHKYNAYILWFLETKVCILYIFPLLFSRWKLKSVIFSNAQEQSSFFTLNCNFKTCFLFKREGEKQMKKIKNF